MSNSIADNMYKWAKDLFPICRSILGPGVRETLYYLKKLLPNLKIHEVPSGTKAFDWTVPQEWIVKKAFIEDNNGNKIIDFKKNNLHLIGYSEPIDRWIELSELDNHLYSLPDQPTAIPYITSYYKRTWGFCLSHNQRKKLNNDSYHVVIDSELKDGVLNYGELIIEGESKEEVILSTYICHPSMANNELSGPVVTTHISQWLMSLNNLRYTYRILFIPETIGSIVYLSKNLDHLKKYTKAGLVLTCLGDDRNYSLLTSKSGDTYIDKISKYVFNKYLDNYTQYSYLERGSDERQFCWPGVDLPFCSIMRSKYGEYDEYHTSLDDLSFISPNGLAGGANVVKKIIEILEINKVYQSNTICEPMLSKYNLYPTISSKNKKQYESSGLILDILAYSDGKNDLLTIAELLKEDIFKVQNLVQILLENDLIKISK